MRPKLLIDRVAGRGICISYISCIDVQVNKKYVGLIIVPVSRIMPVLGPGDSAAVGACIISWLARLTKFFGETKQCIEDI